MIKVGTLCLVVRTKKWAGKCCTVIAPLAERTLRTETTRRRAPCYVVKFPGDEKPRAGCKGFGLRPHQLFPLAPPGLTERETKREPVPERAT